jgi:hypothetical protein
VRQRASYCHLVALCLALFLLLAASIVPTSAKGPSTTSADFLAIYADARPAAMGGAFTALADNAAGLAYNPAGLVRPDAYELTASYVSWLDQSRFHHLSYTHPMGGNREAFGLSILHFDAGGFAQTNELGLETGNKLEAYDWSATFGYGRKLGRFWAVGASGRYIHRQLDRYAANTIAGDLGLLWWAPVRPMTVGIAIQNIGGKLRFINDREPLPLTVRLGVATQFWLEDLTIAADAIKVSDEPWKAAIGLEGRVARYLFLRGGWHGDEGLSKNYSVGLGLQISAVRLDYAFTPFTTLGATHRVTGTLRFGGPKVPDPHRPSFSPFPTATPSRPEPIEPRPEMTVSGTAR